MMLTFLQRQLDGRLGGERVVSSGLALAAQLRLTTHCAGRQREQSVGNGGRLQSGSVLDRFSVTLRSNFGYSII